MQSNPKDPKGSKKSILSPPIFEDSVPTVRPVRWDIPELIRIWLVDLRTLLDDAFAAAEDATRRPSARILSRAEARRKLEEAEERIQALLDAAERGLLENTEPDIH